MKAIVSTLLAVVTMSCASREDSTVSDRTQDAPAMNNVVSKDGTQIAFTKTGSGPALILVSGALSGRASIDGMPLATKLAEHFTVYTYDRRGRGESGDTKPYAVERESEDLEAIIDHAGGNAYVFGVSSGAALSMQASAKLGASKITKLALYEPPYGQKPADFANQKSQVNELVKTGKPGDAAEFFLTSIGMPNEALEGLKKSPQWEAMKRLDFTLVYDYEVLGDGQVPESVAKSIAVPTLVMDGEKSLDFMHATGDKIASLIPNAERKTFAGKSHEVDAEVTVPVLVKFFNK